VAENATLSSNLESNSDPIFDPDHDESEDVEDPPDLPMPIRMLNEVAGALDFCGRHFYREFAMILSAGVLDRRWCCR
jgi:hypothetical protein